ncbi:hypothetical protein GIB67_043234 [Kingdonia uniflora]|uniref:Uncharacterized protein n=1 Tax=Kingdonia uniflora TaxID=39325 RepID=A0A7J7L2K0_9MAGN|nr:hypothetical protein GIB67_043234 [Kingdonia uniflora]
MLRTAPTRRRPRYGAQICAIIAALLLLLSLSLLHSRLSFDRKPHYQSQPSSSTLDAIVEFSQDSADDLDAIVLNPLIKDVGNDGSGNGEDDRIDEFDVVDDEESRVSDEEEILRGVENEEDSELDGVGLDSRRRSSGFVFDHVVINPWEDYSSSFNLNSEDHRRKSKITFGSDDEPVDEEIRSKLDEVKGIEDALLLKKNSKLREGWAPWFEKKSDFLRRDKMFKSNLEFLNPLNNPLLQDPDGFGSTTVLTRGDKLMQKALLNEFRKLPFVVKKSFGIGADVNERKGFRKVNEAKGVDYKTLDDENSSHSLDVDNVKNKTVKFSSDSNETLDIKSGSSSNDTESDNGKVEDDSSELSGHKYADGSKWGYFPGLDPYLSFSNFMEDFFRQGNCSLRVFMVWNSPTWMYSVRHQRGLESLLYHHPDVCVVVFSETIELDFLKDFVKDGYKVAIAMPNLDELLKNTPTQIFASVWFEWRKTIFYPIHYSELVRLAALFKRKRLCSGHGQRRWVQASSLPLPDPNFDYNEALERSAHSIATPEGRTQLETHKKGVKYAK